VGPGGGWALGALVTSAQINQLDIDHANALDKTSAGDTLSGQISIQGGVGSPMIAAGISGSLGNPSIAFGFPFGGSTPSLAVGITSGLVTTAAGGIQLAGGVNDWPTFSSTRSQNISQAIQPLGGVYAGWIQSGLKAIGNNSDSTGAGFVAPLTALHNGGTLNNVVAYFVVGASHAAVPANLPTINVVRVPLAAGVGVVPQYQALSSSAIQTFSPTPGTGAAWYASGDIQAMTYACNQNNVIDTVNYQYLMAITDEFGANSHFGNLYFGVTCQHGSIADMRFP
jgi:hypothetical protein